MRSRRVARLAEQARRRFAHLRDAEAGWVHDKNGNLVWKYARAEHARKLATWTELGEHATSGQLAASADRVREVVNYLDNEHREHGLP